MVQSCRFYENKYPEVNDIVVVNVRSIADMGAYVSLLEYDNIEGMILLSELSRRRIRSINKLIRVGRNEVVMVVRVDKDKGYIDLSKRRVSREEVVKCEEKFQKVKAVNGILRHVADIVNCDLEELHEKTAWKLAKVYGNMYDAFKRAITDPDEVMAHCDLDDRTKEVLLTNIQRRLTSQPIKVRADVDVSCFAYEGVDAVKTALRTGLAMSKEDMPIKINLVAPPLYVITTSSLDKDKGIQALTDVVQVIKDKITELGGQLEVRKEARAVNETDDRELQQMMDEELRRQTEEGDSDEGEDNEGISAPGIGAPAAAEGNDFDE
eukprot:comp18144_c1_seq1/m.18885 comp18144_c1_seq1/g.18885  ORF comp18144_c1_seq1/g.18885 comp18144_c1_seq1/m.18885 type:complete len:323 (-) comp18144_c1_seq1:142-1110(-)